MASSAPASASGSRAGAQRDSRWSAWGSSAFKKSIKISDWAAGYANAASKKIGGENFWPKSDDTVEEIAKCERILRAFTVEGIASKDTREEEFSDGKGNKVKKKRKVLRKIPPRAIKNAKGIVIYTAMRSGIAPFGGAGGTGLVLARLPDGSWSAPASVSPNNLSVGLLLGLDIFDVILLLNTDKAMETFYSHKVTLGAETAIAAGPVGAGASMEAGVDRAPIYSYVRSRGMYAGVEMMGQAFLSRFDENERFYYWPGIKAQDILMGKVRIPPTVYPLHRALRDAETGVAQGGRLERTVYDVVKMPQSEVMSRLSSTSRHTSRRTSEQLERDNNGEVIDGDRRESSNDEENDDDLLQDGERLKLPPTPVELEALEAAGIPDDEDKRLEEKERLEVYKLPPPPMHHKVRTYWNQHPNKRAWRPTRQLVPRGGGPEMVPLPPSPWEVPLPDSPTDEIQELVLTSDVEHDSKSMNAILVSPPPRRKDGQGAILLEQRQSSSTKPSSASDEGNFPVSPPPRRKGGQGSQAPAMTTPEVVVVPPPSSEIPQAASPLSPAPLAEPLSEDEGEKIHADGEDEAQDNNVLGQDMSEAEADAMIAGVTDGGHKEEEEEEEEAAAEAEAQQTQPQHAGEAGERAAEVPGPSQTTSSDAPVEGQSSASIVSGILPPPPRRPERRR